MTRGVPPSQAKTTGMADVVLVLLTVALFALVALIAKGAERL